MADKIILLSGPIASGKSTVTKDVMAKTGAVLLKTHRLIQHLGDEVFGETVDKSRQSIEAMAQRLEADTGGAWVVEPLRKELAAMGVSGAVIVDSVRSPGQLAAIKKGFPGVAIYHVHITADPKVLRDRYESRKAGGTNEVEEPSYETAKSNYFEARQVPKLQPLADVEIRTDLLTRDAAADRLISHCRLIPAGPKHNDARRPKFG
jgi:predicted kinase